MILSQHQRGFTIIELLIATSVFGVVLLIVVAGVIRISHSYYKGIIQGKTQETTRNIAEEISRSAQFANGLKRAGLVIGPNAEQFCIGNTRYTYFLNQQVRPADGSTPAQEGLRSEKIRPDDACDNPAAGTDDKELLATNMRLLRFSAEPDVTEPKVWRVELRVAYGDNELFTHYNDDGTPNGWGGADARESAVDNANCKTAVSGGAFCATSQLDILVKKRLN